MAVPTPPQHALLQRVRELVAAEPDVREVSMFGGRAIMVNNKMIVSVGKNGSLLVRVEATTHESLLNQPGAEQAEMGAGRTMGPGWITVHPEALDNDHQAWLVTTASIRDAPRPPDQHQRPHLGTRQQQGPNRNHRRRLGFVDLRSSFSNPGSRSDR